MKRYMAVITDVDNTLYNFVDFFGPAFRAMVHTLSYATRMGEDEIIRAFREVYATYHSLEYPNSVQKLRILREHYDSAELARLVELAKIAFGRSYRLRLQTYPNVRETLHWLKQQGYLIIAYSDAPLRRVQWKLSRLRIREYFDAYIAWVPTPGDITGDTGALDAEKKWFIDVNLLESGTRRVRVISVSAADLKPNPALLRRIVEQFRIDPEKSWMIGDSIEKDLVPAREVGFRDVWARYGKEFRNENWNTIVQVSPWHDAVIRVEERKSTLVEPSYAVDSFASLQQVIPSNQFDLF